MSGGFVTCPESPQLLAGYVIWRVMHSQLFHISRHLKESATSSPRANAFASILQLMTILPMIRDVQFGVTT